MCLPVKPYRVEREWEAFGLKCAVVVNQEHGHRCGYVRVPPDHPFHSKNYDDVPVEVHGGLTFSEIEPCAHEDGTGWWLGFDCAHSGDSMYEPGSPMWKTLGENYRRTFFQDHYWTEEEVVKETEHLAHQLQELATTRENQ